MKISCSVCPARARSSFPVFGSATLFATCVCWPSNGRIRTTVIRLAQWKCGLEPRSSRWSIVCDSSRAFFTFSFEINLLIRVFQNFSFQLLFPPSPLWLLGLYSLRLYFYLLPLKFFPLSFWNLFVWIPLIVSFFFFFLVYLFPRFLCLTFICFQYLVSSDICFEIVFYSDEDNSVECLILSFNLMDLLTRYYFSLKMSERFKGRLFFYKFSSTFISTIKNFDGLFQWNEDTLEIRYSACIKKKKKKTSERGITRLETKTKVDKKEMITFPSFEALFQPAVFTSTSKNRN